MSKQKLTLKELGLLKYLESLQEENLSFFSIDDVTAVLQCGRDAVKNALCGLTSKNYVTLDDGKNIIGNYQSYKFSILDGSDLTSTPYRYSIAEFLTIRDAIIQDISHGLYSTMGKFCMENLLKTSTIEKMEVKFQRKEIRFGLLLYALFNDTNIKFQSQYETSYGKIDFYNEALKLAIEYDEEAHKNQIEEDLERERNISTSIGCHFIRVRERYELDGLRHIFKFVIMQSKQLSNKSV